MRKFVIPTLVIAAVLIPHIAFAAVSAAGGGLPYSQGINTFKSSVMGEIAGFLIIVAIVCGVIMWVQGGEWSGLMHTIAKIVIAGCICGSAVSFASAMGMGGAII